MQETLARTCDIMALTALLSIAGRGRKIFDAAGNNI
jgi:hypothetical protein